MQPRNQSRARLTLVVLAVTALVFGLAWSSGVVPGTGVEVASPAETQPADASASPSPAAPATATPTVSETAAATATSTSTATTTAEPSATAEASPTPVASNSAAPATTTPTPTPEPSLTPAATTAVVGPASPKMSCSRHRSVAVTLSDGRVLVAGGCDSNNEGRDAKGNWVFGGADVFDPGANRFHPTGKMTTGRDMEATVLLPDGRVLFVGGSFGAGVDLNRTEYYEPWTGRFVAGPRTIKARATPGTILLADGRVLIVGGDATSPTSPETAELFDPKSGTFRAAGRLAIPGVYAWISGVVLGDGRVFVIANISSPDKSAVAAQIYDPVADTFTATTGLPVGTDSVVQAALLPDGRVLVMTGNSAGSTLAYDPGTNSYEQLGTMAKPLNLMAGTTLKDGKILVVGSPSTSVALRQGPLGRRADAATTFDRRAAGRSQAARDNMTNPEPLLGELYDPATGRWTLLGRTAQARSQYSFNLVALQDGRALIVGGGTNTGEIFDPTTNRFTLVE